MENEDINIIVAPKPKSANKAAKSKVARPEGKEDSASSFTNQEDVNLAESYVNASETEKGTGQVGSTKKEMKQTEGFRVALWGDITVKFNQKAMEFGLPDRNGTFVRKSRM